MLKTELNALKLSAQQQQQVEALQSAQRAVHEKMRAERKAHYATLKQQLDASTLDPCALAKQADARREADRKAAKSAEDQALAI